MNELEITILLNTINKSRNLRRLSYQSLSFRQVVDLTEQAVNAGLLHYEDTKISLTKAGLKYLKKHSNLLQKGDKEDWIKPDFKNKVEPFPKNDVFLPDRNELSF